MILKKSSNWSALHSNLTQINNENPVEAGKLFEQLTKLYFCAEVEARSKFKNVWLLNEVPDSVRKRLDIGKKDYGIDLVLETTDKHLMAVQCKFRNDQSARLGWTKDSLSSWLSGSLHADGRILFTNCSGIDSETERVARRKKFRLYSLADLLRLDRDLIQSMYALAKSKPLPKTKPKTPRPDQQEAVEAVIRGFQSHDRGQLILPCGAGKTMVSLWIVEAMKPGKVLVLVPSLSLLKQIKDEWLQNKKKSTSYLCVCSDATVDEEKARDVNELNSFEVDENVTTDSKVIREHLIKNKECIVFSTYQSTQAVRDALKGQSIHFDLAICDEAHRTAGPIRDAFGLIHSNDAIPSKRRLYMTATPRILSPQARAKLRSEHLALLADMSDEKLFGPEFFRKSFKEAIELGILVDYKIISIMVTDREVLKNISQRSFIDDDTTLDEVAHNIALEKAFKKYGVSHVITFHSRVSGAKGFVERHKDLFPGNVEIDYVSGEQPTNERKIKLDKFAKTKKGVLSNARCLTEGVDVPNIDCVYFCDPRNSVVDIVQATGRALRQSKGLPEKKYGYIIVPTFHPDSEDKEQVVDDSAYGNLISVIRAMASQDQRLMDEIKEVRLAKGKRRKIPSRIVIDVDEKINLGVPFSKEALENSIHFAVIEKVPIEWRDFESAVSFVRTLGLKNHLDWVKWVGSGERPPDIPSEPVGVYRNKGWRSWGHWLGTERISNNKRNFKSFEEARAFVRALKFSGTTAWRKWVLSGNRPDDIPSLPHRTYKEQGWISYGDWLGTGNVAPRDKEYRSFFKARQYVHSLKIKNTKEWNKWASSTKRPSDIPSNAYRVYKNMGDWTSWSDFLGTNPYHQRKRKFRDFRSARAFVRRLKIKNVDDWKLWAKSQKRPPDIPYAPSQIYLNSGWISFGDWLGTGEVSNQKRSFRAFKDAKRFVHKQKLKSVSDWRKWASTKKRPIDIPAGPARTYRDNGWVSWPDWLGTRKKNKR